MCTWLAIADYKMFLPHLSPETTAGAVTAWLEVKTENYNPAEQTAPRSLLLLFQVALSNVKMTMHFVGLSPFGDVCLCKRFCQNMEKKINVAN